MKERLPMPANQFRPSDEPMDVGGGLDQDQRKPLAEGLEHVLADTYLLMAKTHGFHWNVTGPQFHSLHALFEQQYTDLFGAVDEIAERMRALGFFAPGGLGQFKELASLKDETDVPAAQDMVRKLAGDHDALARACRQLIDVCDQVGDSVTEDLMNDRVAMHEKMAWMLRASMAR
jgi:starvation-inducible DNA-binding protein